MGRLHLLFCSIAGATLACGGSSAGAPDPGGSSGSSGRIDTTGLTPLECNDGNLVALLTPGRSVESLEIRSATRNHAVVHRTGTPCGGATDKTTCLAAHASAKSTQGWDMGECGGPCSTDLHYLVATRGDTIVVIDTVADLARFLAPIESAAEVVFLAHANRRKFSCAAPYGYRTVGGTIELVVTEGGGCVDLRRVVLRIDDSGAVAVLDSEVLKAGDGACPVARCPAVVRAEIARTFASRPDDLATYFERAARLEAASVGELERIAGELERFDAPAELARDARNAARDEARHARMMASLAKRFGGLDLEADRAFARRPTSFRERSRALEGAPPSLEDFAIDNAVEGCVRESFGALFATYQGMSASDPEIAAAMRSIAHDESRHAELSQAMARWARSRLDRTSWTRVEAARDRAIEELRREIATEAAPELGTRAGVPLPAQAALLLDMFVGRVVRAA